MKSYESVYNSFCLSIEFCPLTSQTASRLSFVRGEHARASGEAWSFSHSQFRVSVVELNGRRKKERHLRSLVRSGRNSRFRVQISTQEKEVFLDRVRIV